jgi:hypothetical protein
MTIPTKIMHRGETFETIFFNLNNLIQHVATTISMTEFLQKRGSLNSLINGSSFFS